MTRRMIKTLLTAVLASVATASAADTAVSIPFADLGNIQSWKADGQDTMLIESQRGKWYRATFWAPCFELPFSEHVGFVTEPGGGLDKFSSIMVGGQRCWFRTFEPAAPPAGEGR